MSRKTLNTKMLSRNGASDMTTNNKICQACKKAFECHNDNIANCFCSKILIDKSTLQTIRSQHTDCLCADCLNKQVSSGMPKLMTVLIFIFSLQVTMAQFAGPVGSLNTTALYKDSSAFVGWANSCVVNRGFQDISTPSLGLTDVGLDEFGTLKAGDNGVVSLGDGGYAILTFPSPITNGPGFDFAVFENAFSDAFLELAFVEVSSDGINYFRFPATSNAQYTTQIGTYDELGEAAKLNNLAGKYRVNYGTPFDLEELKLVSGLDVNAITHVKVIDVVGSINAPYATYDQNSHAINDPFPTPFGNGGFDLDAVGVIHMQGVGLEKNTLASAMSVYPNPGNDFIYIKSTGPKQPISCSLLTTQGKAIETLNFLQDGGCFDVRKIENGIYLISIRSNEASYQKKIVVQH